MSKVITATGRRKSSVAQVKMVPGTGKIIVNGKDVKEYLPFEVLVMDLRQPLVLTNNESTFDITVNVKGGGFSGQTGAIRLAITKDRHYLNMIRTLIHQVKLLIEES